MILLLGDECNITNYFKSNNINYIITNNKFDLEFLKSNNVKFIISYKYRHIIKKNIIDLNIPIVNLHISFLPWNRGADPNLWSFLENTKKGITIHYINEGIDTGDIIYQEEYSFDDSETLESTYIFLNNEIQKLFINNFKNIISNNCPRIKQNLNEGTLHKMKDKEVFFNKIIKNDGYNITIKKIIELNLNNI